MLPVGWVEGEVKDAGKSGGVDFRELGKERTPRTPSMQRNACAAQESISGLLVLKKEAALTSQMQQDYICVPRLEKFS